MAYLKEDIRRMLETNDRAVYRGVLAIYEFQTSTEKQQERTVEHNGVGFNGVDAEILTSFAQQLQKKVKYGYSFCLTENQTTLARKKILKYAGQLANIANAREAVRALSQREATSGSPA